jgi:hypothetical protein
MTRKADVARLAKSMLAGQWRNRAACPRIGDQTACRICGGDIEYHGKKFGWIDRGGNTSCKGSGHLSADDPTPDDQKHTPVSDN